MKQVTLLIGLGLGAVLLAGTARVARAKSASGKPRPALVEGAGFQAALPPGWKQAEGGEALLALQGPGAGERVVIRRMDRAGASGPGAWLKHYLQHVAKGEGRKALLSGVAGVEIGRRKGAAAALRKWKPESGKKRTALTQKIFVFRSRSAQEFLVVVCNAPARAFRKASKSFRRIVAGLKEK